MNPFRKEARGEVLNEEVAPLCPCSITEVLSRSGPISIVEFVQTCIEEAHTLALVDDFRTINWVEEYPFPTITLQEMNSLLATP